MTAQLRQPCGFVRIRSAANRIGTPAACILVTIMAANQAATRSDASLPYLLQDAPQALRFAQTPTTLPPPVRPWESLPLAPAPESEPSSAKNPDDATAPTSTPQPELVIVPPTPKPPPPPGGIELVPDAYSPRTNIRVDDILPFFMPPSNPVSRATYELK
ncbi:MAG: hypothetical protein H2169_13855 [Opitutus sp.]|nr:hypothetical protein [Opitutus sp.]MCS6300969.1 hypothetical protein [Opitutus sp.]